VYAGFADGDCGAFAEPEPKFGFFISRTMIGEESRLPHNRKGALLYFE
jgi:hypothetical protein